jgi:hypothetical protein
VQATVAAKQLKMSERVLRRWCEQGRVPHARRCDHYKWMLPPRSLDFLRKFTRTKGRAGQQLAAKQRASAARMDRQCRELQDQWAALHPPGSYPSANGQAKPRPAAVSADWPGLWASVPIRVALAEKLLHACRRLHVQHRGRGFAMQPKDVAEAAKVSPKAATAAIRSLASQELLVREGELFKVTRKGKRRGVRPAV